MKFVPTTTLALSVTVLLLLGATRNGSGQEVAPLPKSMRGQWTAIVPNGKTFTNSMSVTLDAPAGVGPVTGTLTSRGNTCGATDEPLTGTWDGTELRFVSQVRPNINTVRPDGECGTGKITFVLKRKPGQSAFEGESYREPPTVTVLVKLAP